MFLTALDLGTSQIKVLVAEIRKDKKLSLLGVFKRKSSGIRRGEIISLDDVTQAITSLFNEIRQVNKSALKNIFVNISGTGIHIQNSKGIVAVSRADNEIYQDDIDRVIKSSQAVNLGPNRQIIHTLTKEYIIDGNGGIADPLGMVGNRLEVTSIIIDAMKSNINNLAKCIDASGGEISEIVYSPLASSNSVLSKNQKELGVALIDIGAGTTCLNVFEENNLLHVSVLPIGAGNVTNDLAIGLRCSVKSAEIIKFSFGYALAKEISVKEKLELAEIDQNLKAPISRKFISEIIEMRLEEILELVNAELKLIGKSSRLPAGAVLTGGGAKIPGIVELAKQELKLPVQIGIPEIPGLEAKTSEYVPEIEDPEFSVAAGLLIWGTDQSLRNRIWAMPKSQGWLSKVFKHLLP